jgi:hypothetical protein
MDLVHSSWTTAAPVHGGPWIGGSVMTSPELDLEATPGHGSSSMMVQRRERSTGSPSRTSPGHRRRCGDRATAVKKWWTKCSVWAALGCGEKRREEGGMRWRMVKPAWCSPRFERR